MYSVDFAPDRRGGHRPSEKASKAYSKPEARGTQPEAIPQSTVPEINLQSLRTRMNIPSPLGLFMKKNFTKGFKTIVFCPKML